jgi:glycosyltransferase involved in cell wall biosynthesis
MLITIAIPTYNRCQSLAATLTGLAAQDVPATVTVEILVIDNNSTDETRATVEAFMARDSRFRYSFEKVQGISPARNRALAEARGEWIAWTDDDIEPNPDWLRLIVAAIAAHPGCALFGGKVLPKNAELFPGWLDAGHHAPLALLNRGDKPHELSTKNGFVVGANMIVNTAKARPIGQFDEALGRVGHKLLGSMEDEDYIQRFVNAGLQCLYLPSLVVLTDVQEERLLRKYHWRWHFGHGHHWAVRRFPPFERSYRSLFGVPGHVYRQAIVNLLRLPLAVGSGARIMVHLNLIVWSAGFIRERCRQNKAARGTWWRGEPQPAG